MSSVDDGHNPPRERASQTAKGTGREVRQIPPAAQLASWRKPDAPNRRGAPVVLDGDSEYVSALRLIQRASEAIDMLRDRCRRLEGSVNDTNERLRREAEASERVIGDWERLATTLKAHLYTSELCLTEAQEKIRLADQREADMHARLQVMENLLQITQSRLQETEMRAQAAEQAAVHEGEIVSSFRHTIMEAFGSGSRLESVLAGVAEPAIPRIESLEEKTGDKL